MNEGDKNYVESYVEKRIHSKEQAKDNMIASVDRGLKEINITFQRHSEEDAKNFGGIQRTLNDISLHMSNSNDFMENLKPLADVFRGGRLLSKPSLWIVGLILGIVALTGGLKSLLLSLSQWIRF